MRSHLIVLFALFSLACGGTVVQRADGSLRVELRDNRIIIGQRIQFAHDSTEILEGSHPILDRVVGLIGEHPEIVRVQVQGHTSTDGEEAHNQELSAGRADSVASYLREHGVAIEVTSQGYGETYPLCRDETEECHLQNRRVEFFVDQR
jgi:OOP family OmpA-OmpF porin